MVEVLSTVMIESAYELLRDLKLLLSPTMENFKDGETVKIIFKKGHQTNSGEIRGIHPRVGSFRLYSSPESWYGYSKSDIERFEWINTSYNDLIIKITEVMGKLNEAFQLLRLQAEKRLAFASLSHSRLEHEASVADVGVDVIGSVGEKLRQVTEEQIQTAKEKYSHIDPIINFARIVGDKHDGEETDTETIILLDLYWNLTKVTQRRLKYSFAIDEIGLLKPSSELSLPSPEPEPETILSAVVDEPSELRAEYKNIKRRNKLKKIKSKKRRKIRSKKRRKIKSKKRRKSKKSKRKNKEKR